MELKILKTEIKIGINKPVKLLHITDTHIARDNPREEDRQAIFDVDYKGCAEEYFFKALDYAKKNNITVVHTGDLIDFFSRGNFEFLDKYFNAESYVYAAGNHDFCHVFPSDLQALCTADRGGGGTRGEFQVHRGENCRNQRLQRKYL